MMPNIIVGVTIILILICAIRPLIKFRKETGNCITCFGCSHNVKNQCKIKDQDYDTLLKEIRSNIHKS